MGKNTNIGADASLTVFGNPESFRRLIKNHGQLAKIKQALSCPCVGNNGGSADYACNICKGEGVVYTYQRRFLVSDEESNNCGKTVKPYWVPVLEPVRVQSLGSEVQGGIVDAVVESFDATTITTVDAMSNYSKKRVSYYFDGWTHIAEDILEVDADNGIMIAPSTVFDAEYQSSNPLGAYADIAEIVRIWNVDSLEEIQDYTFEGNMIKTKELIVSGKMRAEYYISDLTQIINADIATQNNNEVWTHELASGSVRMALYPFWNLSRGDIITLPATVMYKNEQITHLGKEIDKLWEMEVFDLNGVILDQIGAKYYINTDYIQQGRYIKWIGNKPAKGSIYSIRYGFKPSFIVFDDNVQANNLENKRYPQIVFAKAWSKVDKNEVARLSAL